MFWRRAKHRKGHLPSRRDGERLRDGDTVLYPGRRRAAEAIADEPLDSSCEQRAKLPDWYEPTVPLPHIEPRPGRRYVS